MNWLALSVFFLGLLFLACDSHEVEQINVKIPANITVPDGMVYIPAGEFIMGSPEDPRTKKGKKLSTPHFLIDKFEVSRSQFQKFKPDHGINPKAANLPVSHVTYSEALAYCQWKKKRLPTETEWEKSARGVDGRKWPWLQYFKHPNNGFSGFQPEDVGKRKEWISPYGLYGMGHNVWEWTADWYTYEGQPNEEREKFKVIRGGLTQTHLSINFSPTHFRNWMEPEASFNFLGFRCAADVSQP